ncbi:MAG: TatD family hydrolase [Methylophilaceae bacterium]|nr:TatD family hydrolase [Methylophilaceae bacterium]
MLIDTHCHLDAAEFDADRDAVAAAAHAAGVAAMVIPAVAKWNFAQVTEVCQRYPGCWPAYGIHPLYVDRAVPEDLEALRAQLAAGQPVAVGEIGLDFYVEGVDRERQAFYFSEQLKLARKFDLPVILHVRRAIDAILQQLRRYKVKGGIAHAFNGSRQQADEFMRLGFKLGFGGAMTYERALHLRELARTLPLDCIVLETDAPDIPPAWIGKGRNSPAELPRIAAVLAELRGVEVGCIMEKTGHNALETLPKIMEMGAGA